MVALEELDRLLVECLAISGQLNQGERRTLDRFIRLRKRHGTGVLRHLSMDDVESLEDWTAAASATPKVAEAGRTAHTAKTGADEKLPSLAEWALQVA